MPSDIDVTKPEQGNATTLSVRQNFSAARSEILDLQAEDTAINTRVNTRAERAGDIGGTTTSSTVVAIQNRAVSGATPAPTAGQPLTWQATPAPGHWEPMNVIQLQGTAVSATAPTNGQQLRYDTTAPAGWKATTNTVAVSGDVTGTGDASAGAITATVERIRGRNVLATAPTNSQALVYNGTDWTPGPVTQLQGRPVNVTAPSAGQALVFSGTEWTPTSGGAAPQSIIFRPFGAPADVHTWIPDGTEGVFATEGTNVLNAPDLSTWRYLGHSSAALGEQTILAMSQDRNGVLMQKTRSGGTWSGWITYATLGLSTNNIFTDNLTPNGASNHTGFTISTTSPNQSASGWDTIWQADAAGNTLAYALTTPTVAGQPYWFNWNTAGANYSGNPNAIYLRNGATNTTGQQQILPFIQQNGPSQGTYTSWTGFATGAFTHVAFVSGTTNIGINSLRFRGFVLDTPNLLVGSPAPVADAQWTLVSGTDGLSVFNRSGTNSAGLNIVYQLATPIEPGQVYWIGWRHQQVSTSDYTGMAPSVFLRTGPTDTTGQIQLSTGLLNQDQGVIRSYNTAFTHIVVVANSNYTNGTFQMLQVTPVRGSGQVLDGLDNLIMGDGAFSSATSAFRNVVIGGNALFSVGVSNNNTVVGFNAVRSATRGDNNTVMGQRALFTSTTSSNNVTIGNQAMEKTTSGGSNVGIGATVMPAHTTGSSNVIIGNNAALNLTTAGTNVIVGPNAGRGNLSGAGVVAIGSTAFYGATAYAGTGNTAVGTSSLYSLTSGTYNTALGHSAMYSAQTASNCVAVGYNAGRYRTGTTAETDFSDSGSIYIGHNSRTGGTGRTNQIVIGVGADGQGTNTVYLGNTDTLTTNGLFCRSTTIVQPSDVRLKQDVVSADLDLCLQAVKTLPVRRFHWNEEYSNCNDNHVTGFIADDVETVFPKSIVKRDETFNGTVIRDCKSTGMDQALPTLWGAVQKLIQENENLKHEIAELKEHKNGRK